MRKFALYYGVTRKGEKKVLAFGNRSEIKTFKDQCIKDFSDPKMAAKYSALVLATDYGLKNTYKPVHPDAEEIALKEQEAAVKADAEKEKKAEADAKKAEAAVKKAKEDSKKASKKIADDEQADADARLKNAEDKAGK